jgi:prepilin-type processing-associated H-X9-DG protein
MTRLYCRAQLRCAFTFVELLVVILLCVLLLAFLISCQDRAERGSNRVKCSSNLRQIGQAMILYANDNGGAYPMCRMSESEPRKPVYGSGAAATQPTDPDGPAENDVTAALFMLLRTQDITSEVFTCPSSNAEKDLFEGKDQTKRSNFTDLRKNLSYSMQNPYARKSAIGTGWKFNNTLGAEYAVAADRNPGLAGKDDNVLKPTATSSANEMRLANTNNHDKDGQNILYGDGHVAWESNPFVGTNRDNIYTTADGQINASPVDANDSILLPTDD